jgi:hypothetical protein
MLEIISTTPPKDFCRQPGTCTHDTLANCYHIHNLAKMTIAINDLLSPAAEESLLKDSWVAHTQKLPTRTSEFFPPNDKFFEVQKKDEEPLNEEEEDEDEEASSDSRGDSDDDFELVFEGDDTLDNNDNNPFEDAGWTDTEPLSGDDEEEYESDEEETVAATVVPPFWWSYEEPDQIKAIIDGVTKFLKLDIEAANCIREPKPYIACIKRISVSLTNNGEFETFDRVYICRRCTVAPGTPFPFVRKEYLLTRWDREEGLPKNFVCVTPKTKRTCKNQAQNDKASCLYCLPQLFSGEDNLFASNQKLPFTYLHSTTIFDGFLPKEKELEEDDGETREEENPLA